MSKHSTRDSSTDIFDEDNGDLQTLLIAANTYFALPNINQQELVGGDNGQFVLEGLIGFSPLRFARERPAIHNSQN